MAYATTAVNKFGADEKWELIDQAIAGVGTRAVIAATAATQALTKADSGSLVILDRAAGVAVTLPVLSDATTNGVFFDFIVLTSASGGNYTITSGEAADLYIGGVVNIDTDTGNAVAYFSPDVSDDRVITFNGTTTGGLLGTSCRVTALSASRWNVEGIAKGNGTVATPFS